MFKDLLNTHLCVCPVGARFILGRCFMNKRVATRSGRNKSMPNQTLVAAEPSSLLQSSVIPVRMHTCFALYPFWLPSKNGYQDITIKFFDRGGKISTYWAVTFDAKYGPPRELAYDLDSLLIARRFDEIGRPLPSLIPLGSLRSICRELGLQINGKNVQNIRHALAQNQWAQITADIHYTAADGGTSRFNANFNRYSVIYAGQRLPSGATADCVYILLNELYLVMLNNSRTRPLDYDYLRDLKHISRRFYEIISFHIFAALKYNRPEASIHYSRLCMFSAQTRSYNSSYVSAQMGKIHKRHLESGYLASVRSELVRSHDGEVDWVFHYTPGPRARREFHLFNRSRKGPLSPADNNDDFGPALLETSAAGPDSMSPHALVKLFHTRARNIDAHNPLQKEIKQAQALLDKHGAVKAAFIVDFAARRAKQTRFDVQQFGGLFVFAAEGELAYDHQKAIIAKSVESKSNEGLLYADTKLYMEAYENARAIAAAKIEEMTPGERASLEAEATRLINERSPSMKRNLGAEQFKKNVFDIMHAMLTRLIMKEEGFAYDC